MLGRRRALAVLGIAIGSAFAGTPACARTAAATGFRAPDEPMRLTRVLERELGDGARVTVTRTWQVRFVARESGYLVEGEQVAVDVDAPPRLAPLADVERKNRQAGPFPLVLDNAGLIVSDGATGVAPIPGLEEAAREYLQGASAERRAEAMQYVLAIQQAGAAMASRWPEDLFYPVATPRTEERALPLPDGGTGTISVSFGGALSADGDRLDMAQRRIVTIAGGSTRVSREIWRLEPLQ